MSVIDRAQVTPGDRVNLHSNYHHSDLDMVTPRRFPLVPHSDNSVTPKSTWISLGALRKLYSDGPWMSGRVLSRAFRVNGSARRPGP